MPRQLSLAARAILAVGLMIGFYALAFGIAGFLLLLVYADWRYARDLNLRLVIFSIAGAGMILWSILPRPDRFLPPGPRLEPAAHPRLFAQLTQVASAVGQAMPAEVYLIPQVNAWVAERGGVMGFGSRRVMGLGLPLLQVLKTTSLRAVLAHEFGHYHGGDTRLGPWVYKTRAAIGRAFQNLSSQRSILVYPFLWYGKLFMRVTLAISRRQEFAADELASRKVGAQALIDGLRAIHGAAMAYGPYWQNEAGAVLNAGFRPPLAEGFARFIECPPIARAVSEALSRELAEGKATPYDTHPALRERLKALEGLPKGEQLPSDPPAISLLDNLPELETCVLVGVAGEAKVRALKPVSWEDVGRQVLIPQWQALVQKQHSALEGLTAASIPEAVRDLNEFARRAGWIVQQPISLGGSQPKGAGTSGLVLLKLPGGLSPEEIQRRAVAILGAGLATALYRQGWQPRTLPGENFFEHGQARLEPFSAVLQLVRGELDDEAWRRQCAEMGINELSLGA